MLQKLWMLMVLVLCTAGCGITQGLSHSESLANYHPLFLTATKSKGDILTTEGLDYLREGSFDKFLSSMDEALKYYSGDSDKTADIRRYMGKAYLDRNEYDKALSSYRQSLSAAQSSRYQDGVVFAKAGLADCYKKINDTDRAMEILADQQGNRESSPETHPLITLSMGQILAQQGRLPQALELLNKSLLNIDGHSDDKLKQSIYSSLGTTLSGLGRNSEAISNYQLALGLARKTYNTSDIVDILNNIGFCLISMKKYDDAARSFQEGLGLLTVMNLQYPEKQLYANYGLGLLNEQQYRNPQALLYYTQAIKYIEDLRGSLSSTEFRSLFLSNKIAAYEHAIDILIAGAGRSESGLRLPQNFASEGLSPVEVAFFYAESTKARSFLDLLSKARTSTLANRLPRELADREQRLLSTIDSIQSAGGGQSEGQQGLLKQSKRELDELIAKLRKEYPDYASIRYPEPVMAGNIPLRDNEVLLTYKVNPEKTYLWVIEKDKRPQAIEIAVSRDELTRQVREFRSSLENPASTDVYDLSKGRALGRLLLADTLNSTGPNKNIIVVPDGILNMLPFEALSVEKGKSDLHYLGDSHRISYYPSASVMATMRRNKERPALANPFFGLGDPVYDDADPRIGDHKKSDRTLVALNQEPALNMRSVLAKNGFTLNRLPETRDEVLEIGALFGYKDNNPNIKLDMAASKKELLQSPLGSYRFIHFATHGLLSGEIPYILEPSLVLTQQGNTKLEDGFLKMSDVLDMRLNADAVVLSACKTALGKEIAGEGVVGLSRAFMLAGSKSVIVSLWSVESNSTAALMKSFYSYIKAGKSKEEALRRSKEDLKNQVIAAADLTRGLAVVNRERKAQTGTSHPFFWAPFILIGEWE